LSKLFIELYLDEDVDVLVADLIRARGFTVVTTRDAGNLQKNDDEQLAHAVENQLTYVTHNRADFEARALEYFADGKTHPGIIIAVRRPPQDIARRLFVILNNVTADEMINQIRYI
jgi:predicted nuclease of predicted toxin-antitoxin system